MGVPMLPSWLSLTMQVFNGYGLAEAVDEVLEQDVKPSPSRAVVTRRVSVFFMVLVEVRVWVR